MEFKIYGEETHIYLASWVHCETCADLWYSLRELGYECVAPGENVRELVQEYAAMQRELRRMDVHLAQADVMLSQLNAPEKHQEASRA
ncbi:MAG: hypothetical protein EOM92_17295 [Gammaproteobacteria bacterium]|nr:hypothetical protein [Gammaproteobacteria bacterium]